MKRFKTIVLAMPSMVILSYLAPATCADEVSPNRENQLKAAYLFNFVKFVEWPAGTVDRVLTLCFLGGDGVHDALASSIDSKKVGGLRLAARRLAAADRLNDCNVLYIGADYIETSSAPGDWHARLISAPPVLTISDSARFTRAGGMVELFTESNRLRFNINIDNASEAGLNISSNLLQLAATVETGGER